MPTTITMPQLGETVTEGTVAQWLKKPGDVVEKYEAFVEVSTDKVNAEVPAPVSGRIREVLVAEGQTVPTGAPIAIIDEVGAENASLPHGSSPSEQVAHQHNADKGSHQVEVPSGYGSSGGLTDLAESRHMSSDEPVPGFTQNQSPADVYHAHASGNGSTNGSSNGHAGNGFAANSADVLRRVSPAVRRLAREHDIDITVVRGTGENGRVTANDVLAAAAAGPAAAVGATIAAGTQPAMPRMPSMPPQAPAAAPRSPTSSAPSVNAPMGGSYTNPIPGQTIALSQARKIIAQRMVESVQTAPHAWTMVEVDVTNVWKWRSREKDTFERDNGVKLTLLPFFIRAVVESLAAYPLMNAKFTEEGIHVNKDVNVSIAVALDGNLILPVIRNADTLSIKGIALAAGALIDKARRNKLGPDDLAGGTFTVNNTGANGSVLSAPIIPIGQTGIVTMEAVVKRPVVTADESIAVRSMMNVCLSLDHRVVDGSVASGFLVDLKRRLEAMGPTGAL